MKGFQSRVIRGGAHEELQARKHPNAFAGYHLDLASNTTGEAAVYAVESYDFLEEMQFATEGEQVTVLVLSHQTGEITSHEVKCSCQYELVEAT